VEAAGFVFGGAGNIRANPDDPYAAKSIRGHMDRFIFRFRKPQRYGKRRHWNARSCVWGHLDILVNAKSVC